MQLTLERLQRLASCKAQYVGIQREGQYPFVVKRDVLSQLINGLPNSTKVNLRERLEIVSARRDYKLVDAMGEWKGQQWRSERIKACATLKARATHPKPKAEPKVPEWLARELRIAERALGRKWRPDAKAEELFAWLHPKWAYPPWEYEGITEAEWHRRQRERILAYHKQRPLRKQVARVIALYINGCKDVKQLNVDQLRLVYKRMRELGRPVASLSKQSKRVREQGPTEYVKGLAYHAGLQENPCSSYDYNDYELDSVRNHNKRWCEWRLAWERVQYLRQQIEATKQDGAIMFEEVST